MLCTLTIATLIFILILSEVGNYDSYIFYRVQQLIHFSRT